MTCSTPRRWRVRADGHAANWSFDATIDRVEDHLGAARQGDGRVEHGQRRGVRAGDRRRLRWMGRARQRRVVVRRRSLPFLKRLEDDRDFPDGEFHGSGGPMPVDSCRRWRRCASVEPGVRCGVRASSASPSEPDKNAPGTPGCGPLPRNVVDGVRINAALAYIVPNRDRANLTIESRRHRATSRDRAAAGPSGSRSSDRVGVVDVLRR